MIQSDMALLLCRVEFFFYYAGRVEEFLIRLLLGGGEILRSRASGVALVLIRFSFFKLVFLSFQSRPSGVARQPVTFFQQQKKVTKKCRKLNGEA
jgi:hypothetical protein